MRVALLCVLVLALAGGAVGELPSLQDTYKILMLLPVSSKSHRNVFMPLAEALANRGHQVVMLTNHPRSSKHPNILEIYHGLPHFSEDSMNMFEIGTNHREMAHMFGKVLTAMARDLYKVAEVKNLYNRRKEFDLIIIKNVMNEPAYPFVHEIPFITISTSGIDNHQSSVLGNVLNPAYFSDRHVMHLVPMSAWHRFSNTYAQILKALIWRNWSVVPFIQKEISAQFPDLPPLLELERNQSLVLINSHFNMEATSTPLLPSQVQVAAMHCRPATPLPQDLEDWISGAGPEGVIYFSLGSFTRGNSMPAEYRDAFLEAFRRLPHRVIWKYEDKLEDVSDNIMIRKWLPQQDILAHDNVKVFLTHGGLLSLQEAVYHATPLLSMPIYGDQPRNAMFVKVSGLGDMMVWEDLTVDALVTALTEIAANPKYKENVVKMSSGLRDQQTMPLERAIFWTEYVIRHQGAPQLRCPAALLSWVEFLMLDILALLLVAIFLILYTLRRVLGAISAKVFGSDGSKKKME